MDYKSVVPPGKKGTVLISSLIERVERIPWYWVALFTSLTLLIISILVKNIVPINDASCYGGEYGAVGAALAQGRGFSDPFSIGSGATAWVSPLLPAILSFVFYLASFKVTATYWILHCIKIFSLGLSVGLIWDVLQKSNRGFALISYFWMGFLCYIHNIYIIYWFHDEWLIFLLISVSFWAWHKRATLRGKIFLIVSILAAALSNPILWAAVIIVILILSRTGYRHNEEFRQDSSNSTKSKSVGNVVWIAIGVSFLLIAGWTARNWVQLKMFAPIKSNAGYEIFQAQIVSRNGTLDFSTFIRHPYNRSSKENKVYAALGETAFIQARKDMAIRSIWTDPNEFRRRVVQRFSNAFLFTASPDNIVRVNSKICNGDLERLRKAGFVGRYLNEMVWVDLDDYEKDLVKVLPSLGLANPQLVEDNWRAMAQGNHLHRFSWERIIGGCLIGGMPWVALLIAILLQGRLEIAPEVWWAALFLFLYLIPYVLISHYLRYQLPLLGMQSILLTTGSVATLKKLKQKQYSSTSE